MPTIFRRKRYYKPSKLFIIFLISVGIYIGYRIFSDSEFLPKFWNIGYVPQNNLNYISEENILKEIKNSTKLITQEIEFSESIIIDDSWGDWDIFKKFKRIIFIANCSFAMDITKIKNKDIAIDKANNKITISIDEPYIYSIEINEEKTTYEDTHVGLLRFGDVELTPEEYDVIKNNIKKNIEKKLLNEDIYSQTLETTKTSLKNILSTLINENTQLIVIYK